MEYFFEKNFFGVLSFEGCFERWITLYPEYPKQQVSSKTAKIANK